MKNVVVNNYAHQDLSIDTLSTDSRKILLTQAFLEGVKKPDSKNLVESIDNVYLGFRRSVDVFLKREHKGFKEHLERISVPQTKKEVLLDLELNFMSRLEADLTRCCKRKEVEAIFIKGQELGLILGPESEPEKITILNSIFSCTKELFSFIVSKKKQAIDITSTLQEALLNPADNRHLLIELYLQKLLPSFGLSYDSGADPNKNPDYIPFDSTELNSSRMELSFLKF